MALKDLVVDQEVIEEELIEKLVSPYVRFDPKQQLVVLTNDGDQLEISQKITIYLLALKGWRFIEETKDVQLEAFPKEISVAIVENGSTVRNHLQALLHEGIVSKTTSGKYTILPQAVNKVKKLLKISG